MSVNYGLWVQALLASSRLREATAATFSITSGSCSVVGTCFQSPSYPSPYPANSDCEINVLEDVFLDAVAFETESGFDFLTVNSVEYSGSSFPDDIEALASQSPITFTSDYIVQKSGFKICAWFEPTASPSLPPSPSPTTPPTPAPTPRCDAGYSLDSSTHACRICEAGKYANITEPPYPSSCSLCAPGRITPSEGSLGCTACSGGLSNEDRTECRACIAGEYAFNNEECVRCPAGQYAPTAQVDSCLKCQAGDITNNATGATACSSCEAGTYSQDLSTSCSSCAAGRFSRERASACIPCDAGSYASSVGSAECIDCSAGREAPDQASTTCTLCAEGKAAAASGQPSCLACVKGTFSALQGQVICKDCPAGRKTPADGLANCSSCPAGKSQEKAGSSDCEDCASGKFSADSGSLVCTDCPFTYSSHEAASSCDLAEKDYAIDPPTGISRACATQAASCPGGSILPIPKLGFWVDRSDLEFSRFVYACDRATCTGASAASSTRQVEADLSANKSSTSSSLCWSPSSPSYLADPPVGLCDSNQLQCLTGSRGPLCGSCEDGYTLSSALAVCVACDSGENLGPAITALVLMGIALLAGLAHWLAGWRPPPWFLELGVVRLANKVDGGMLKVMWSTFQIISTVSWNLGIAFPDPFTGFITSLSFLRLDFISLDCVSGSNSFYRKVYAASLAPIFLASLNVLAYGARRSAVVLSARVGFWEPTNADATFTAMNSQHAFLFLALSYLVLPPVAMLQFEALNCIELQHDRAQYLKADTAISCFSEEYEAFRVAIGFFVFIYQSIPCMWFVLLWQARERIDPLGHAGRPVDLDAGVGDAASKKQRVLEIRNEDASISFLSFLWSDYEPSRWYFEVVEMYRRIMFIGVVPLLGNGSLRASVGCVLAIVAAVYIREEAPFIRNSTNVLLVVAQYQILLTFFGALVVVSDALGVFGLKPWELGAILVAVNCAILALSATWCVSRYMREREEREWRRALTTQQLDVVQKVMGNEQKDSASAAVVAVSSGGTETPSPGDKIGDLATLKKKHLLKPKDVVLKKRVGAGSFGEVFLGQCKGKLVAVKTMLNVNDKNMQAFRSEILLTASLQHPNIVNFVGACWGQELVCLVLEWVPKGSLGDLLVDQLSAELRWEEPLLRLTTDVAKGMAYLHGTDRGRKLSHIHRDLKPDNVLVTAFLSAKITDFGTSRELADADVTMTAVGTPLFCAPEVMRGEHYTEKADVYSFGMLLLDIAVEEPVLDFLRERWRVAFGKKKASSQPMRVLRPIIEEGWRPVSEDEDTRLSFAPRSINSLIVRCCSHNPSLRPPFAEVETFLSAQVAGEVAETAGGFGRYDTATPRSKRAVLPSRAVEQEGEEAASNASLDTESVASSISSTATTTATSINDDVAENMELGMFSRGSRLTSVFNPMVYSNGASRRAGQLMSKVRGIVPRSLSPRGREASPNAAAAGVVEVELPPLFLHSMSRSEEGGKDEPSHATANEANNPVPPSRPSNPEPREDSSAGGLPPGWEEHTDPVSGRAYFSDKETGEVSWELPAGAASPLGCTGGEEGAGSEHQVRGRGDTNVHI